MLEAVAAFDGAARLMDDPNHGIRATQKRALQLAKQQNPDKYSSMQMMGDSGMGGQALMALLPLLLLGGVVAIFGMSKNIGQALGLSLALAGIVGVLMLGLARK